jgi:hypothetical protein
MISMLKIFMLFFVILIKKFFNFFYSVCYLPVAIFNFFEKLTKQMKGTENKQNVKFNNHEEELLKNLFKEESSLEKNNVVQSEKSKVGVFAFFFLFVFKFFRFLLIRILNILSNIILFNVKLIYILFEGFDSKHLKNVPDFKSQLFGDSFISENPFKFFFSGQWYQPPKFLGKLTDLSSALERSKLFKSIISNEDKKGSFRFYLWKQKRDNFYLFSFENQNLILTEFIKDGNDSKNLWIKYYSKLIDFSFNEKIMHKLIVDNLSVFFRDKYIFLLSDELKNFLKHFDIFFTLFDFLNESRSSRDVNFLPSVYLSMNFLISFWIFECSLVKFVKNLFNKLINLFTFLFFGFIICFFTVYARLKKGVLFLFFFFESLLSNLIKFIVIFVCFYKSFNLLKLLTFKNFFSSLIFVKKSVFFFFFFLQELSLKEIFRYYVKNNLRLFFFNFFFLLFSFVKFFFFFLFVKLKIYFKSILWFPLIILEHFFLAFFFFLFGKRVLNYLQIYIRQRNLIFPYFPQVFNLGNFYTHFLANEGEVLTFINENEDEKTNTSDETNYLNKESIDEEGDFDRSSFHIGDNFKTDSNFFNSYEIFHKFYKNINGEKNMFDVINDYSLDENEEDSDESYLRTSFFYTMLKGFWSGLVSFFKYIGFSIFRIFKYIVESKVLSYFSLFFFSYLIIYFWSYIYIYIFESLFLFFFYNLVLILREKIIKLFRKNRLFVKFLTYYYIGLNFFYAFFYDLVSFMKFILKFYVIMVNFFCFGLFKVFFFIFTLKNKIFRNYILGFLLSPSDFLSLFFNFFFLIFCSFISFIFFIFFEFFIFIFLFLKSFLFNLKKLFFLLFTNKFISMFLNFFFSFFIRNFSWVSLILKYFLKLIFVFIIFFISIFYIILKIISFLFLFLFRSFYTFFFVCFFLVSRPFFFILNFIFICYNYIQAIYFLFIFKKYFKNKILGFVNVLCIIYTVLSNKEIRNKLRVRGLASLYTEFLKSVSQKHPLHNIFFFNSFQVSEYFFYNDILSSKQTFYDISKKLKSFYNIPIGTYLFNRNFHERFLSKDGLLMKSRHNLRTKKYTKRLPRLKVTKYIVLPLEKRNLSSQLNKIFFFKKNWLENLTKKKNKENNLTLLNLNNFVRSKACKLLIKKRELCFKRECGDLENDIFFFFVISREIMRHSQKENLNQFSLEFESWFENYQQNIAINHFFKNKNFNLVDYRGNVPKSEISKLDFWTRVVEFRFFLVSELKRSVSFLFFFLFFILFFLIYFLFINFEFNIFLFFYIFCILISLLTIYFFVVKFFIIPKLKLRFRMFFVGNLLSIFKSKNSNFSVIFWLFINFIFNFKNRKYLNYILALEQNFIYEKVEFLNKKNPETMFKFFVKFFFFYFSCFFVFCYCVMGLGIFFFNLLENTKFFIFEIFFFNLCFFFFYNSFLKSLLLFLTRPSVLKTDFFWNFLFMKPGICLKESSFLFRICFLLDKISNWFFFKLLNKEYVSFVNLIFFYESISNKLKINKQNLKDEILLVSKILEKNNSDILDLLITKKDLSNEEKLDKN